jgi:ATP-dependent DNA ligase
MSEVKTTYDKTIYKKDSKNKIRYLRAYTIDNNVCQESGIVDTESPVLHTTVAKAKNVGKVNETTPEQQAILEASAKLASKMSEGYFETIEEATDETVVLPMLAKDFNKEKKKVVYPCYVQPKLDGVRALGKKDDQIISRKGKEITTMDHIQKDLDTLSVIDYLDGELYAHGLTFQENIKAIKKDRGEETKRIHFHVYDLVLPNLPFRERSLLLKTIVEDLPNVELVPTFVINNEDELKHRHKFFIEAGFEGTIVRHSEAGYGINKRDSQLLKYKDFQDLALKIVMVVPMEKVPEHGAFVFEWKGAKGHPLGEDLLGCGMKFSHKERIDILLNKEDYIGKTAELRFFEYSDDGVPRFPVAVGIRFDK